MEFLRQKTQGATTATVSNTSATAVSVDVNWSGIVIKAGNSDVHYSFSNNPPIDKTASSTEHDPIIPAGQSALVELPADVDTVYLITDSSSSETYICPADMVHR